LPNLISLVNIGHINSSAINTGPHQNYLRYTQEFQRSTSSDWVRLNITTVNTDTTLAPDDTITADTIIGSDIDGRLIQTVATSATGITATGTWNFSIYLKSGTDSNIGIQINSTDATGTIIETGTVKDLNVNNNWQRFEVVENFTTANNRKQVVIYIRNNTVIAWGAQLEPTSYAGRYSGARTTSLLTTLTNNVQLTQALSATSASFSSSIASSSTITSTRSGTPTAPVEGLRSVAGSSTSSVTVRPSPQILLAGTAWNTSGTPATNTLSFALENLTESSSSPLANLRFLYGGNAVAIADRVELMRLTSSGFLGIGKNNPLFNLDVDGTTSTDNLIITSEYYTKSIKEISSDHIITESDYIILCTTNLRITLPSADKIGRRIIIKKTYEGGGGDINVYPERDETIDGIWKDDSPLKMNKSYQAIELVANGEKTWWIINDYSYESFSESLGSGYEEFLESE
jgi:hypothetical protein